PMRKHVVSTSLLLLEGLAIVLTLLFFFKMRPALVGDLAGPMGAEGIPPLARVALSRWLIPGAVGVGSALLLAGFVLPVRAKTRLGLFASALVVTVFALAFAVGAAYQAAFGG